MQKQKAVVLVFFFLAELAFSKSKTMDFYNFFERPAVETAEKRRAITQCAVFADLFFSPNITQKVDASAAAMAQWRYALPFFGSAVFDESNIRFGIEAELSTSSFSPRASFIFTPFSFFSVGAGASASAAWHYGLVKGLAKYNEFSGDFEGTPFFNSILTQIFAFSELRLNSRWFTENPFFDWIFFVNGEFNYCHAGGLEKYETYIIASDTLNPRTNGIDWTAKFNFIWNFPFVISSCGAEFSMSSLINSQPQLFDSYKMDFLFLNFATFASFEPAKNHRIFLRVDFGNARKFKDNSVKEADKSCSAQKFAFKKIEIGWIFLF